MKLGICLCLILCLFACSEAVFYQQSYDLSPDGWSYEDKQQFSFESIDSLSTYDITLDILHDDAYGYENLYILIKTTFPDGQLVEDMVSIPFLSPTGSWQGKKHQENRLLRVYLQQQVKLQQVGTYSISIEQHSRDKVLQGIKQLSLSLLPVAA